ncbi:symmetrical bis(5'-nucleosyl)-tetraphosphatase [Catenovulum sediminis]|uniref:symmetrical bis(5'-nucleosyl)-tetraphosphatase n=1 Tax=Catenovulum sediminis TaxID=1740262 RepID=UPI0011801572|nr:symmetrical bis(5'-nucleosyl)-tetraphosphatase [Catenovulum sediminis]
MAHYFVGDIQGCYEELMRLLDRINFDPTEDKLCPVGDLVARGPDSDKVAKLMLEMQGSVEVVLGNHDLHFLSVYHNLFTAKKNDKLEALLNADFVDNYVNWLKRQPLFRVYDKLNIIVSHAGMHPHLSLHKHLELADFAQQKIAGEKSKKWLKTMYGDKVSIWHSGLSKEDEFKAIINIATRMRYIKDNGELDFKHKNSPQETPYLTPWFDVTPQHPKGYKMVFGHWASLMGQTHNPQFKALDTGCVWGNHMTMYVAESDEIFIQPSIN